MIRHPARWKLAGIQRGQIRTLARALMSVCEFRKETQEQQIPPKPTPDASNTPAEAGQHAAPGDFSDLVALAGAPALDDGYHDYPSALHATASHARGVPDNPSVLLEDHHSDPLLQLSAEYERALLHEPSDPHRQLDARAVEHAPIAKPPRDPFEDAQLTPSSQSLVDLLLVGENIDTILDGLDSYGEQRLFEFGDTHEILTLFAGERPVAPRAPSSAPLSAQLAREEHHLIGVDSRIDVLATPSDEPVPHHEDHR